MHTTIGALLNAVQAPAGNKSDCDQGPPHHICMSWAGDWADEHCILNVLENEEQTER